MEIGGIETGERKDSPAPAALNECCLVWVCHDSTRSSWRVPLVRQPTMWGTTDGGVHDAVRAAELSGVGVGDASDATKR